MALGPGTSTRDSHDDRDHRRRLQLRRGHQDRFRFVRVPEARPEYAVLKARAADADPFDLADIVACRIGALGEARWRRYLDKHSAPPARKE